MPRILFLLVILLGEWYSILIIRHYTLKLQPVYKYSIWGLYILISLFVYAYIFSGRNEGIMSGIHHDLVVYLRGLVIMVVIAKIMTVAPLLIDDIRRLITWVINQVSSGDNAYSASRSKFLRGAAAALGSLPLITLGYGMLRNAYRYKVYETDIAIEDLPDDLDGLRIIQFSDLHSGSFAFKEPVERAVKLMNDTKPDVIFFTGDLVNSKASEMEPFVPMFQQLNAKYGVYSVMGNHDYGSYEHWDNDAAKQANHEAFLQTHKNLGWNLLRNESETIQVGKAKLGVLGVENISAKPYFPKFGDLSRTYAECEDCDVKVLLSHDPSHWEMEVIEKYKDIDLTLSGHTHGFQFGIEIPGFIKWSPSQYMYEQWAGLYNRGKQYLYVNRGLGFLGYPGRVGILPEISLLTLRRK